MLREFTGPSYAQEQKGIAERHGNRTLLQDLVDLLAE